MSNCLGLFAKYWQPGKVKTRLAARIGDIKAAGAYQHFVEALVARTQDLGNQRWLAFAPPEQKYEFERITAGHWELEPQADGDLGRRMQAFFSHRLGEGYERIVLIGTDSPNVPLEYIRQAFARLQDHDAVLGPTEDGGYWLVGASTEVPELFADIPWSTPQVWETTIAALRSAGRTYSTVPPWYDVDEHEDLQRLIADLRTESNLEPALATLLETLQS